MARGSNIEPEHGPGDSPEGRASLGDLLPRLIEEIRTLITAEVRLYRLEAIRGSKSAGIALGLIIAALTLVQGALIAMLVGLVMLVAEHLGTGWAIVIVTLGAVAVAALLGWLAWARINAILDPDKRK